MFQVMLLSFFDNMKNGQPVVFIHGTASANDVWEKQYNLLGASNYRLIGIDLRGHGKSKNPGGVCTIDDHVNDLKQTLDYIGIQEPVTIIGHSFGAVLAVKFAEEYPRDISKLLLVSLPTKISKLLTFYYQWLLGKPIEFLKTKINFILKLPIKRRYKLAITSDLDIVRQIFRDSLNWDFLSHKPKISCPVYLSVGNFDYVAQKGHLKKLHHEIPNSKYKVFKWASHTCMEDSSKEFNHWLLSVL